MFHLPDNADRAVQENVAAGLTEDLRQLANARASTAASGPSDGWKTLLAPVLELWKSTAVTGALSKLPAASKDPSPMEVFFFSEATLLATLLEDLQAFFTDLGFISEGTLIPPASLREEALEMVSGRMPNSWMDRMDGPRESKLWISLLSRRFSTVLSYAKSSFSSATVYDLSNFLRPETFFNALRQHTARQSKVALVDLKLVASVASASITSDLAVSVNVSGASICIQGALMSKDGKLSPPSFNSPSSTPIDTNLKVGWISAEKLQSKKEGFGEIMVYGSASREQTVFALSVPCTPEEKLTRSLGGVACFILAV
ncbi:hypothetical protein AGDE_10187 [Angomonas deanei]|nr:hypothetical protein AGDE_10187 [Angomonas deanei]|eukprot:EPY28977.1 hypothetical protein AGDE_10187 [Angomonas deanei]